MEDAQEPRLADLVAGTTEMVRRYVDAIGDERATELALQWVASNDPAVRGVGFETLGSAALNHPPALEPLLEHAAEGCADEYSGVRAAVAQALGQQSAQTRCVPLLMCLLDDPDVEVRRIAIGGLPITLDEPTPDHPAVQALVRLLADPEPMVRDCAAFALGTQLDVDSAEIRTGLHGLLTEPSTDEAYPAAEAAFGLARRADPEVYPAIANQLTRPALGSLWLEAASELADGRLLPALLALRAPDNEPDDPWVQELERSIACCSTPGRMTS